MIHCRGYVRCFIMRYGEDDTIGLTGAGRPF